jgi:hypothetical protein
MKQQEESNTDYRRAFIEIVEQLNKKTRRIEQLEEEIVRLRNVEIEHSKMKIWYLERINEILTVIVEASRLKKDL